MTEARIELPPPEPKRCNCAAHSAAECVCGAWEEGPSRNQLEKALAECRDAFPIPPPGAPHEHAWGAAMGDPLSVPHYVRAAIAAGAKGCPNTAHMGEHACNDRSQCWEPCGELGHSEEHVRVGRDDPAKAGVPACRKCGGAMKQGKAIAQTVECSDEGTCSPSGPGVLIDCMKCERCGWSVTRKGD